LFQLISQKLLNLILAPIPLSKGVPTILSLQSRKSRLLRLKTVLLVILIRTTTITMTVIGISTMAVEVVGISLVAAVVVFLKRLMIIMFLPSQWLNNTQTRIPINSGTLIPVSSTLIHTQTNIPTILSLHSLLHKPI